MLNKGVGEEKAIYYKPFVDLKIILDFQVSVSCMYIMCLDVPVLMCSMFISPQQTLRF